MRVSLGLSCTFIFFILGYLGFWLSDPTNLPVSNVKCIAARQYVNQDDLQKVLLRESQTGFVRLKVSAIQQQLLLLPWIKQVDVRKVWPNQLVIQFDEYIPAALWNDKGVISDSGVLFFPDRGVLRSRHLPVLEGPEGKSQQVWQHFLGMQAILTPVSLSITNLNLAPRGAWNLKLSNGITLILGTDNTLLRLQHFVRVYEKSLYLRQSNVAYVDLRYTNGMAIGWRPG